MEKILNSFIISLFFCLAAPLCAEQPTVEEKIPASLEKREQNPSLQTQQQGNPASYDRHLPSQSDYSTLPQTSSSSSEPVAKQGQSNLDSIQPSNNIAESKVQTNHPPKQASNTPQELNQPKSKEINASVRPILKNALNIWVNGEALLWQATEENLTYVYRSDLDGNNDLKTVDFEWDWGFRVSGGYNLPYDGWDASVIWTHLENHASDSSKAHLDASGNGIGERPYLQAAWGIDNTSPPDGRIAKASAHWNVHLDQVDLGLGREFIISKYLTVRPKGGLRADWIDQKYKIKYTQFSLSNPQTFNMSNRFFGFGFFAGADSDWKLWRGFSLYSMTDFALLLGFFDIDQNVHQLNTSFFPTKGDLDTSFRCGRGILDLSLGLKWQHLFDNNSWAITFRAGYEYHLYFSQNQYENLYSNHSPNFFYNKAQGDLTYQGVILSGQFDF
jgi:hypothetical protein